VSNREMIRPLSDRCTGRRTGHSARKPGSRGRRREADRDPLQDDARPSRSGARLREHGRGGQGIHGDVVKPGDVWWCATRAPRGTRDARDAPDHLRDGGMGLDEHCGLVTDGRFSGSTRGPCIGHVSPEAAEGAHGPGSDGMSSNTTYRTARGPRGAVGRTGAAARFWQPRKRELKGSWPVTQSWPSLRPRAQCCAIRLAGEGLWRKAATVGSRGTERAAFGQYLPNRFIPLYYQLENILRSKIEAARSRRATSFRRSRSCLGNTRSAAPRCDRPWRRWSRRTALPETREGTFVTEKASQTKSVKLTGFTEDLFSEGHQAEVKIMEVRGAVPERVLPCCAFRRERRSSVSNGFARWTAPRSPTS